LRDTVLHTAFYRQERLDHCSDRQFMTSNHVELHWYICKTCHSVFLFAKDLEEHINNSGHKT